MKVQVNIKNVSKSGATSQLNLTLSAEETVQGVKERIAASQLIAFPEQDLVLDGKVLKESDKLGECGVKDCSSLDFVVRASETSLVEQLSELLQARDLTCDELGLLYCYKNGVSINQALKNIGSEDEKFPDFVKRRKEFVLENGRVALVRCDTALKPFSVAEEVKQILEDNAGSMDVTSLCSKFVQKFNVSIASVVNMRPVEFFESQHELFVMLGRSQVALKSVAEERQRQKKEVQARPQRAQPAEVKTLEPVKPEPVPDTSEVNDSEQYLELHNTISGRSFNSKVAQTLNDIVEVVTEKSFVNITQVVKTGSVGKGTAITGTTDAEVVFFLGGMPLGLHNRWLPPLLKAVSSVLTENLDSSHGVEDICVTTDSVHMKVKGCVEVDLKFSPAYESYEQTISASSREGPDVRRHLATSLSKEKSQFIAKQPGQVKVTMRLLKWWRNQQEWSCAHTKPTDDILELLAVYSALQTKPRDQRMAIANAMSLMARFDELRVVWSNYYNKEDIWAPLMHQRPLLMDPVNPFVNAADPQTFDPRELMSFARTTHFFW